MKFSDLRLIEPLLRSISTEGYDVATPIQAQAIPHVLEGKDLLGCAQTGTGKTAAFALPILHRLAASHEAISAEGHSHSHKPAVHGRVDHATDPAVKGRLGGERGSRSSTVRGPRCLVLCPTRELALQISDSFRTYGRNLPFKSTVIFGGVNQHSQVQALRHGVDIVVATPGRLLDLMDQRCCDLRNVETLVLDEADRMLDMGFIHDIRRIVAQIPTKRQTLLFSATMPREIRSLADSLLRNPVTVQVAPPATTLETIEQSVYFVDRQNKPALLAHLYNHLPMARAIVFTRTKHGADRVVRHLHKSGIRAEAIHGNKSQNARERALANFRANKTPILVATDIASRGIDVDGITHVVNYDLTHEPETYVHRIGRTARAGASGAAVSFCDREERPNLKAIESLIRRSIPVKTDQPQFAAAPVASPAPRQHPSVQPQPRHAVHSHRNAQPQHRSGQPRQERQERRSPNAGRPAQQSGRRNRPHAPHPLYARSGR